jgi:hypothetical protein
MKSSRLLAARVSPSSLLFSLCLLQSYIHHLATMTTLAAESWPHPSHLTYAFASSGSSTGSISSNTSTSNTG